MLTSARIHLPVAGVKYHASLGTGEDTTGITGTIYGDNTKTDRTITSDRLMMTNLESVILKVSFKKKLMSTIVQFPVTYTSNLNFEGNGLKSVID